MEPTAFIQVLIQAANAAFQGAVPGTADALTAYLRVASEQAALIAVTGVWQGVLVASGLAICLGLAPRASAEHRFSIWAVAFFTLVSLPLLTFISEFGSALVRVVRTSVPVAAGRPLFGIDARWSLPIAALWAAGALLRAGDLALDSFRLRKLWKEAIPVDLDGSLISRVASVNNRGLVQVCTTTTLQRPSVIGFSRPRILIPDWLFGRLTAGELEQIMLHETEHLRRRDDWTNLLQKVCLVLFPLNPALLWIERRLCREREMACDDGVIRITHAPRAYAACLASLAERGLERRAETLSLGAWQRRPELVQRVHSILRRKGTLGVAGTRVLLSALGCSLLFGTIALARCPRLIAFVPARDLDRNGYAANGAAAVGSEAGARIADAAFVPARSVGAGHGTPAEFHTVNLEAVLPSRGPAVSGDASPMLRRAGEKTGGAVVSQTASHQANPGTPRAVMLKTDLGDTRSAQPAVREWIVFTTVLTNWDQMQTPNENATLTADYETGASGEAAGNADAAGGAGAQTNSRREGTKLESPQPAGQITITRLIFRVIPASSFSMQPAYVPLRGGWFVIQL